MASVWFLIFLQAAGVEEKYGRCDLNAWKVLYLGAQGLSMLTEVKKYLHHHAPSLQFEGEKYLKLRPLPTADELQEERNLVK